MVIKNITKFEEKEIKQSILDDNMWDFTKRLILIAVFFLLGLFITIFNINNSNDSLNFTLGIGFMAFGVFSFFFHSYKLNKMKKNIYKDLEYEFKHGIIYEYSFHEEKFGLTIKVGEKVSKMEAFYKNLKKIVNYNETIVFVLSNGHAYKCKKSSFNTPKEEELFFYGLKKHNIKITDKIKEKK